MKLRNMFKRQDQSLLDNNGTQSTPLAADDRVFAAYSNPHEAENFTILLEDDQNFQLNISALFPASHTSLHNFRGKDLPRWAEIDVDTGVISGTVTHDASVFGRVKVIITADDKDQNEVALALTLSPQNLAAIADMTIHDREIVEQTSFTLELEALFYDPFTEIDPQIICVSGLPTGLRFYPESNTISGEALEQTAQRAPYVVTAWAQGEQNKLTRQHFLLKVTDHAVSSQDRRHEIRTQKQAKLRNSLVAPNTDDKANQITDSADSVWSSGEIKGSWGIKMPTIEGSEACETLTSDASQIDWKETVNALEQKQKREGLSKDGRLDRISIDALRRQNKLYLEFQNKLDDARDGKVQKATIQGVGGSRLPEWMEVVREGLVTADLPPNIHSVELELNVEFGNGHRLVKPLRVDF